MRLLAAVRARSTGLARAVLVFALVVDCLLLRGLLLGRDAAIARFDRFAALGCVTEALAIVAFGLHYVGLVRTSRLEPSAGRAARDARALRLASGLAVALYLGFHTVHGPLGALARGLDAYGLVDDIGRSFSTMTGAAVHAVGLTGIVVHAFEVTVASRAASRRVVTAVVSIAIVFVVTALDPIAAITVGRPLYSRPTGTGPGMTSRADSATLPRP